MKSFLKQDLHSDHPTTDKNRTTICILLVTAICCILTAIGQGSSFFQTTHYTKVMLLTIVFLAYFVLLYYLKVSGQLRKENTAVFMMLFLGILIRCGYVLLSGLYDRQHDAGIYTGMGTPDINSGHIGYIEYLYKFGQLPDMNPYEVFGYYHPPFHHIISCLWLQLNLLLGTTEELAFENLQIIPLLYSCLTMTVTWKILKTLDIDGNGLFIALAFAIFHPATIIMAGSVNNDMLTTLFMAVTILYTLKFIRDKQLKYLVILALSIGFGMITKLNSAVLAVPVGLIFLLHFISVIRAKDRSLLLKWIKNYCIFAVIVIPIGLSWIIRNALLFRIKPGVPVPGEESLMYTGTYSLWDRLGIPSFSDWRFHFPFHPFKSEACHNTWVIMFHTSLFTEEYPTELPDILLILCQIVFFLAVVFGVITAVLLMVVLLKKLTNCMDRIFLLSGYAVMLFSFAAFVIIYPYTCSSDFRYITICLVYIAIALGLGNKYYLQKNSGAAGKAAPAIMHFINWGILTILLLSNIIYLFWERW
ncbi:MAG: glycosyltransferase family 39 protein [Lachnospiraceae bacterium]|nr:glycosyltransferase family 39 protein [Lachnospiraceae bacterium]